MNRLPTLLLGCANRLALGGSALTLTAILSGGCSSDRGSSTATDEVHASSSAAISQPGSQVCTSINATSFGELRGALVIAQTRIAKLQSDYPNASIGAAAASVNDTISRLDSMTDWMGSSGYDASNASTAGGVNITLDEILSELEEASRVVLTDPSLLASPAANVGGFAVAAAEASMIANDIGTDAGRCYADWAGPWDTSSDPGHDTLVVPTTCEGLDGNLLASVRSLLERAIEDAATTPADDPFISYVSYFNDHAAMARTALDQLIFALWGSAGSASDPRQAANIHTALIDALKPLAYADWWSLVASGNGAHGQIRRAWERTVLVVDLATQIQVRADACAWPTAPPTSPTPASTPETLLGTYVRHNPPALAGDSASAPQRVNAFIQWASRSMGDEREDGRVAIAAAGNDPAIANALIGEFQVAASNDPSRALIVLAILGELKSDVGEDFFIDFIRTPLPSSGTLVDGIDQATVLAEQLQSKAVDGLAYRNTSRSNQETLAIIASHASAAVRAEAIRAYQYNRPQTAATELARFVRDEDAIFIDRVEHGRDNQSDVSFNGRLAGYLRMHPEAIAPTPPVPHQVGSIPESADDQPPTIGAPKLPTPIIK